MRVRDWLLGFLFVLLLSVDGWGQTCAAASYADDLRRFEAGTDLGLTPAISLLLALFCSAWAATGGKRDWHSKP